jgi:hypothetical protein
VNQLNEIKNAKEDTLNSNGSNECHIILDIKEKESTENIEIIENSVNEKTVSVNELDVSKVNVEITINYSYVCITTCCYYLWY